MRIGVAWTPKSAASNYRAVLPLKEMERRGHEVVWPRDPTTGFDPTRLVGCELVHVYRRFTPDTRQAIARLRRAGAAVTWDNDDDYTNVPKEAPAYKKAGGLGGRKMFGEQLKMCRLADTVTVPTQTLAERYRQNELANVVVVENLLPKSSLCKRARHSGIVIGWIAGYEHRADAVRLQITDVLRRVVAEHPDVRVECIGVNLNLSERYRHDLLVPFSELTNRIRHFDIGIAPLADIPFNHARSDIKLKEYAAAGVPWLASPVGPYAGLGSDEGGRLVPDDGWYEALDWLVDTHRARKQLGKKAARWAKTKTVAQAAQVWEQIFVDSLERRQAPAQQRISA